ncbi:MAG: 5'/3'-nucleotidase SurE [Candidatus Aminicenantes bacterium]|nr:5'/3'-nucleotidase SurE [Candidatus Aminicenantes bacterium]
MRRRTASRLIFRIICVVFLAAAVSCASFPPAGAAKPLRILVTNDDGWDAPGISALVKALRDLGEVVVAAPARNHSGAGHSMTFDGPIAVRRNEEEGVVWYVIDARPATCVRLAVQSLLAARPALFVGGINRGANLGTETYYSGTLGCAREAAVLGIPALAVSLERAEEMDYRAAAALTASLIRELTRRGSLGPGLLLNINVPARPAAEVKGFRLTRLDARPAIEFYEKRPDSQGAEAYWPGFRPLDPGPPGTDTRALADGYVSVTPLDLDRGDGRAAKALQFIEGLPAGHGASAGLPLRPAR